MNDERYSRFETKLDKLDERLDSMDKVMERNTASLELHMKRSDANEAAIEEVKKAMSPVITHVNRVTWMFKGIAWFVGVVGSIIVVLHELGKI